MQLTQIIVQFAQQALIAQTPLLLQSLAQMVNSHLLAHTSAQIAHLATIAQTRLFQRELCVKSELMLRLLATLPVSIAQQTLNAPHDSNRMLR